MTSLLPLLSKTLGQVWLTFSHNWPYLLIGAMVAAALKLYTDIDKVRAWLERNRKASVYASTGIAVTTPFCSCGTTAVVLGMLASTMPWAPIVAFMVASPLTSPEELFYSGGLFGWPFALTFFGASIVLGLSGGFLAKFLEDLGYLKNQARFQSVMGGTGGGAPQLDASIGEVTPLRFHLPEYLKEIGLVGRRLLLFFLAFAFIGYFLNNLIPAKYISALFGSGSKWGVPLAATLGIPLYLNSESSLPLIKAFMQNGASEGAAMAFLITGAGTSVGAIVGALTVARWRILLLVVGTLWVGAIAIGYLYNVFILA